MEFETTIGIEVHVELLTKTKVFCRCRNGFGAEINTNVCEVCLGLPGSLPRINKKAIMMALKAGIALGCEVTPVSRFDRKNYFYPDLPKAYQISQLYAPLLRNGKLQIRTKSGEKLIRIHEIHLEEDAGKLIHDKKSNTTLVDYNRAGVPLIEIVTEPDFKSAEEVVAFLQKLKDMFQYMGISDCKIEEGSMRADINLSVNEKGSQKLGTRTELKNLASFKSIISAIEYESERQIKLIEAGGEVTLETRRFDEEKLVTVSMRRKEKISDYKYFPEPDLRPVVFTPEDISEIKKSLPEFREAKTTRYIRDFKLSEYEATTLTADIKFAEVFEKFGEISGNYKEASNFMLTDTPKLLSDMGISIRELTVDYSKAGCVIKLLAENKINRATARKAYELVLKENIDPISYIEGNGLYLMCDEDLILKVVSEVIQNNNKAVNEYREGNTKSFQYLLGQSMRALKGAADHEIVRKILQNLLET